MTAQNFWLTPEDYNKSVYCESAVGLGCPDTPPTHALPGGTIVNALQPISKSVLLSDMERFRNRKMNGQIIYALNGCYVYIPDSGKIDSIYTDLDQLGFFEPLTEKETNALLRKAYSKYWRKFPKEERPEILKPPSIFTRIKEWLLGK